MSRTAPDSLVLARRVRDVLDGLGPTSCRPVRDMIAECGIKPGIHVGTPPGEFTDRMRAEWWLGQVADAIDKEAWCTMNTILNAGATL